MRRKYRRPGACRTEFVINRSLGRPRSLGILPRVPCRGLHPVPPELWRTTPPQRLAAQLDALARAGYTTITPDQLLAHLRYGTRLPARPVMLSFDDASEGQYTHALPMLLRHRFTATFFMMTVVLDKPRWLS